MGSLRENKNGLIIKRWKCADCLKKKKILIYEAKWIKNKELENIDLFVKNLPHICSFFLNIYK